MKLHARAQRVVAVVDGGYHVEAVLPERVGEQSAHERRVVGDQDPHGRVRAHGAVRGRASSIPENSPSGFSRMISRSSTLAIASIRSVPAPGTVSS